MTGRLRRLAVALALTLALAVVPAGAAGAAGPQFRTLTIPARVTAGEPFTIVVTVASDPLGAREALLVMQSPSGQEVDVRLTVRSGLPRLEGTAVLPVWAEPGTWRITAMFLVDNEDGYTELKAGPGFEYRFAVRADGPVDLTPPLVRRVRLSADTVEQGAPLTVMVAASDDLSGVQSVRANLAAVAVSESVPVRLAYSPLSRQWEGTVAAPFVTGAYWLRWVEVQDAAGNWTVWYSERTGQKDLLTLRVVPRTVPRTLAPAATLQVLEGRELYFADWVRSDQARTRGYLENPNRLGLRTLLIDELERLGRTAALVGGELYRNPARGILAAGPATTGKAWALAGAIRARLLLLLELDRRSGRPELPALTAAGLADAYRLDGSPDQQPLDRQVVEETGPAFTDAVIRALLESGLGAGIVQAPHLDVEWSEPDFLPDGGLWVVPYTYDNAVGKHRLGDIDMVITMDEGHLWDATETIQTVLHELGHHVAAAYFGQFDPARPAWREYLALRGRQPEPHPDVGHDGFPDENLAEDIAFLFAPAYVVAQHYLPAGFNDQSYPLLASNPAQATALLRLLTGLIAAPTWPRLTLTAPAAELAVLADNRVTVQGRWAPGHPVRLFWIPAQPEELQGGGYEFTARDTQEVVAGADGIFRGTLNGLPRGSPVQVMAEGLDAKGMRIQMKALMAVVKP